ncbi:MAG: methyl-accepting chemotaxis protein, partial [Lachnospiraceae bacterium]|nr:methyl-accepting chemotaxis protein [Lachnospiraceae bacterium]
MKNLKFSKKLFLSFTMMAALSVVLFICGAIGMSRIQDNSSALYHENVIALQSLGDIRANFNRMRINLWKAARYEGNAEELDKIAEKMKQFDAAIQESYILYEGSITNESDETAFRNFQSQYRKFLQSIDALLENSRNGNAVAIYEYLQENESLQTATANYLEESASLNAQWGKDQMDTSQSTFMMMIVILSFVMAAVLVIAVILTKVIVKVISAPLQQLEHGMHNLADGVFEASIQYDIDDEIGSLVKSVRKVIQNMKRLVPDIDWALSHMANGDFTVKSREYEVYTGDYAPILESMRKIKRQLSKAIYDVQESAQQVKMGAQNTADAAQNLAEG